MTTIRLDAAAAAALRAAEGRVRLCDPDGKLVREVELLAEPPQLSADEWRRRVSEPGGKSTAEVVAYLESLARPAGPQ